jgi:hypothetical protein
MLAVKQWTNVAFTWYVLIGTTATFATGYALSVVFREPVHDRKTT